MSAINACAWKAYVRAHNEFEATHTSCFRSDPFFDGGSAREPADALLPDGDVNLSLEHLSLGGRFESQLWLNPLDPFARYVVYRIGAG